MSDDHKVGLVALLIIPLILLCFFLALFSRITTDSNNFHQEQIHRIDACRHSDNVIACVVATK